MVLWKHPAGRDRLMFHRNRWRYSTAIGMAAFFWPAGGGWTLQHHGFRNPLPVLTCDKLNNPICHCFLGMQKLFQVPGETLSGLAGCMRRTAMTSTTAPSVTRTAGGW
jgi:hypothetical protein